MIGQAAATGSSAHHPQRVLITGAFGDGAYRFGFFERIAEALEGMGLQVGRFNAFGFPASRGLARLRERLAVLPARLAGRSKAQARAALGFTPEARREWALIDAVRAFAPDQLIVIAGFRHRADTLQRCRELGVRELVGWFVEGPLDVGVPESESPLYDRYYCIHRELAPAMADRIGHLPSWALDQRSFHRLHFPREVQRRIVFVGTPTPRRIEYLRALEGLPLELWGPKWQRVPGLAAAHRGDFIWGEALNRLYNESAVVLNLSSWPAAQSGMTQRIVEVPAAGAYLLTDDSPELAAIFTPGFEVDTFDSPARLRQRCEAALADASRREQVAVHGHARALGLPDYGPTARRLAFGEDGRAADAQPTAGTAPPRA